MPWFKVDDGMAFHHKVVAAGNAAIGLWARAGAMCAQQLTDGFVADHMVAALGNKAQATRLVQVGLWDRVDGGYRFHEWDQRNPLRDDVERERAEARERMQKLRAGSANVRPNTKRTSPEVPDPDPSLPLVPDGTSKELSRNRGQRLPENWLPDETVRHQMAAECPGVDLAAEHRKFTDHWRAKTGRDATKLDWNGTWRNWIRNARASPNGARSRQQQDTDDQFERAMARATQTSHSDQIGLTA